MKKGLFVISLDFELIWGVRDKKTIESYGENIRGVRKVIPALLDLFNKYDIHATFATVGFLFARNKEELLGCIPGELPQYNQRKYSPYENNYLNVIGKDEQEDIYHYAPTLIELVRKDAKQEIASHTFSHYYCLENASLQSFEADLLAAKKIAGLYNVDLKSIVFPRNQYTKEHIEICQKLGFTSYRGNEMSRYYHPRKNEEYSKTAKVLRYLDSYVNVTGHHSFNIEKNNHDIVNIPASRFLRPFSPKLKWLNGVRLNRIKKSLTYAAKRNETYHLWWHPHNFGTNLSENLMSLEEILRHYQNLKMQYGMQSRNMKEISEALITEYAG